MEIVDDSREFFAPVSSDLIDGLLGQYQQYRKQIDQLAGIANGDLGNVIYYFIEGNCSSERGVSAPSVGHLFNPTGAIFALNAAYWSKALALTDVYDCMPQARRDYWDAQLKGKKTIGSGFNAEKIPPLPDFEESTVRATLSDLLAARSKFFAERVDGIFRGLSGEHVTNAPEAFGKRMIIGYMLSYGSIRHEKAGLINDLRCVIAKFMGRDEPKYQASSALVSELYRCTGKWNTIDAGALRIRVYKKGTAHLEVHPDIAWRLNQVLSNLYPSAIPAEFRQKPKKKIKEFQMMGRPLPFAVLALLGAEQRYHRQYYGDKSFGFDHDAKTKNGSAAYQEAVRVLVSIGGVMDSKGHFQFDYCPLDIIHQICITGCVPDQKSHQFYPTPASIGAVAVEMAGIGDDHSCLEPSAGQGDLADLLPKERTTCVEISVLHCDILKARGFKATQADFLEWAHTAPKFDRIVMNPPFSEGRAVAHLEAAAGLAKPGGRVVAILPASMRGKDLLPGWKHEWSTVYSGEFDGTGVSVAILRADRPPL